MSNPRRGLTGVAAVLAALASLTLVVATQAQEPAAHLEAVLIGSQEVPAVATESFGIAYVLFIEATGTLHWVIDHDIRPPM